MSACNLNASHLMNYIKNNVFKGMQHGIFVTIDDQCVLDDSLVRANDQWDEVHFFVDNAGCFIIDHGSDQQDSSLFIGPDHFAGINSSLSGILPLSIDYVALRTKQRHLQILKTIDFRQFDIHVISVKCGSDELAVSEFLQMNGYVHFDAVADVSIYIKKSLLITRPLNDIEEKAICALGRDPLRQSFGLYNRVLAAFSCSDCDYIPKVKNAGRVFLDDKQKIQIMHNGLKVLASGYTPNDLEQYYGYWMSDIIALLRGHHEPQEEKVFYEILKEIPMGAVMIELGSNWSYYSMWFNKSIDQAQNFMIEPNAKYLEVGKKHFEMNNLRGNFTHGFIGARSKPGSNDDPPTICLDDFIQEHNISHVDIIHSDIQGYEYLMLLGCRNSLINEKISYFIISTHSEALHKLCIDFLKSNNFIIIAEHSPQESFSCDGLVAARHVSLPGVLHINVSHSTKGFVCGLD